MAEARAVLLRLRNDEDAEKELNTIVEAKVKAGPETSGSTVIKVLA